MFGTQKLTDIRKFKSWRTTILLPWAAALMIAGFAVREAGAYHTDNLTYLIVSVVLIMSGPPVYALINYFVLSRVLYYIPYLSPMHPGRVVTTFVGLDAVCEVLIGQGAWRMANSSMTEAQRQLGANLVTASLALQSALFGAFGLMAAQFHYRSSKPGVLSKPLRTVLLVLYVSATIVTIRCIYRLVEYTMGWDSTIYKNEALFWVFEASIMLLNTILSIFGIPESASLALTQSFFPVTASPNGEAPDGLTTGLGSSPCLIPSMFGDDCRAIQEVTVLGNDR